MTKTNYTLSNIIRALRLPFASASILPFIAGSLLEKSNFNSLRFLLGCIAVISTHLSANLINDYADSKSGADWQDRRFYGLFGGSKLIQENIFPEKFYLNAAIGFSVIAALSILGLVFVSNNLLIISYFMGVIVLAWSYSQRPLRFSYYRLGEFIIFLLFGPALVMGGYYVQTNIFPTLEVFFISLPFGLLTTAILYINEIPDFPQDIKVGKFTWVSFFGHKNAYIGYAILVFLAFSSIILCIILGYFSLFSLVTFLFVILAFKATTIAKNYYNDKIRLVESSKLTIIMQTLMSVVLTLDILL